MIGFDFGRIRANPSWVLGAEKWVGESFTWEIYRLGWGLDLVGSF